MPDAFLWLKALHVIAVVAWMAGLFYLPRLFVYHSQSRLGDAFSEQFKIMEHKLSRVIMLPSAVGTWIFGISAAWVSGDLNPVPSWLIAKLAAVVCLTGFHALLEMHRREFNAGARKWSEGYFRIINEFPTVLLVVIVILVVVKPF